MNPHPLSPLAATRLLLRFRVRSWWNAACSAPPVQKRVGAGLFLGSLLLFTGILIGFHSLLEETNRSAGMEAVSLLVHRVSLFLFLFLLAGGVPFVSSTLLAQGDLLLLAAAPVRPVAIAVLRLIDSVIVSSGQFVAIGIPLLVAVAWALHLSVIGWCAFIVETLLLLTLPVFAVAALLLTLVRLLGTRRVRSVVALTSAALSLGMCLLTVREFSHGAAVGGKGSDSITASTSAALRGGRSRGDVTTMPWMPSEWIADSLLAFGAGDSDRAMRPFLLLLGTTVVLGGLCTSLAGATLVGERLLEGDDGGLTSDKQGRLERALSLFPLSPPARALVAKDLRYVFRDLVLLSQIGIPIILYFVPFVIGGQIGSRDTSDLLLLSAGIVGTIVYMETSILSLSSLGLEGRAFWIILTAPLSSAQLIRAKWFFALFSSLVMSVPLLLGACVYYAAGLWWTLGGLFLLVLSCFALCGFGVGIAGIFPRFIYENPAHRASLSALIWGFVGATLYLLLGAIFVGLGITGAQQWPEEARKVQGLAILFLLSLSSATAFLPLLAAERRLNGYAWEE